MLQLRKQLAGEDVCAKPPVSGQCPAEHVVHFNFPPPIPMQNGPGGTFLRLNGLDSQSCFECHNSIGERNLADTKSAAFARKVGVTSGPAGFASSAFINPAFQDPVGCDVNDLWVRRDKPCKTTTPEEMTPGRTLRYFMLVRNPPHVFGTGYGQALATEMSKELNFEYLQGVGQAVTSGKAATVDLQSKGVDFGSITITPKIAKAAFASLQLTSLPSSCGESPAFRVDITKLQGVSCDLIVRPFQWKGIAQNERNFVTGALNFHFGMQTAEGRECSADNTTITPPVRCIDGALDYDRDGVGHEMGTSLDEDYGNVTALTIFTMSMRPPKQAPMDAAAAKGFSLFKGDDLPGKELDTRACSSCHRPALLLEDTKVTVQDPRANPPVLVGEGVGFVPPARHGTLPTQRLIESAVTNVMKGQGKERIGELSSFAERDRAAFMGTHLAGFTFDLQMEDIKSLPLSFPRLKKDANNHVKVPLFSDLRRHHMGAGLCDQHPQATDDADIPVPRDEFLTRPLWGVADTGPWLHDGRATSLNDAILLHAGSACDGIQSEANPAVDQFKQLSTDDQKALILFLETLQLPLDPRYTFDLPPVTGAE